MKEERMKILQMIEDGIITAKEGVELLGILKNTETAKDKIGEAVRITGELANSAKEKICEYAKEKEPVVKETVGNIANMAGDFAEDVGKAIKSVINKDSEIIDEEDLEENDIVDLEDDDDDSSVDEI